MTFQTRDLEEMPSGEVKLSRMMLRCLVNEMDMRYGMFQHMSQ